jgi:hypothetical protein
MCIAYCVLWELWKEILAFCFHFYLLLLLIVEMQARSCSWQPVSFWKFWIFLGRNFKLLFWKTINMILWLSSMQYTHSHKNGPIDVSTVFQSGLKSVWNIATCVNVHLKALFESFEMIYNMHIFIYMYYSTLKDILW